jgi:hypothetical protein
VTAPWTPERAALVEQRAATPHLAAYRLLEDVKDLRDLLAEVARLTEERDDARESLRVEREDRARTLAALRRLSEYTAGQWAPEAAPTAYAHAADLVAGGGR